MAQEDITCEQFLRTLADDIAGELGADQAGRNARHLASCAQCTTYRRDYEAVVRAARASGEETPAPLPARLAERILAARQRPH